MYPSCSPSRKTPSLTVRYATRSYFVTRKPSIATSASREPMSTAFRKSTSPDLICLTNCQGGVGVGVHSAQQSEHGSRPTAYLQCEAE